MAGMAGTAGGETAAVGAGVSVVEGALGQKSSQRVKRIASAISHGSRRANADLVSSAAAVPAAIAALPAAPAPLATAAPARLAVSAAAPAAPPRLLRNDPGVANPSALVIRLSSAPCRFGPWLESSDESELALSPRSPIIFFRNVRTRGTTTAIRLVADELLMPLEEDSALTTAPALSPKRAGT